jgi:hypothetical protein
VLTSTGFFLDRNGSWSIRRRYGRELTDVEQIRSSFFAFNLVAPLSLCVCAAGREMCMWPLKGLSHGRCPSILLIEFPA